MKYVTSKYLKIQECNNQELKYEIFQIYKIKYIKTKHVRAKYPKSKNVRILKIKKNLEWGGLGFSQGCLLCCDGG